MFVAPNANSTPSTPAGERQQHALGQELTQQPPAVGADRHPDRHLAGPRGAARQLQVGHVGAGDQQQERDTAEEQLQAGPHLAARDRHVQIVPQRRRESLLGERRRLLLREPLVEGAELLLGRLLRDAGRQPDDRIRPREIRARQRERKPESVVPVPAEPRRHHADDRVGPIVEPERLPERVGAALEQPQPQLVAQDDDRLGVAVRPDVDWAESCGR